MKTYQTEIPAMFGDHHVREVRKILQQLPGIDEIYASSSFQILELSYDESKVQEEQITALLEETGYLGEFLSPQETNRPATEEHAMDIFRHTAAFNQTRKVSFHRESAFSGRPLWPCPGMGAVKTELVED